jgi:hypothetical protein
MRTNVQRTGFSSLLGATARQSSSGDRAARALDRRRVPWRHGDGGGIGAGARRRRAMAAASAPGGARPESAPAPVQARGRNLRRWLCRGGNGAGARPCQRGAGTGVVRRIRRPASPAVEGARALQGERDHDGRPL